MNPGMDAEGAAPLIIRAIERVWVRLAITLLNKTPA
jgi:hypothetical protein